MIKGINRQVLEVNNTENEFFEKVVFYVKPEHSATAADRLNYEASMYAKGNGKPPRMRRGHKGKLVVAFEFFGTFLLGGGFTAIVMNIFS